MIKFMLHNKRCNVFASPGTGKTASTLFALSALQAVDGDVFPILVVAPKRVANRVWSEETALWSDFAGLRVAKMLGDAKTRTAALESMADVYTINPANLDWLRSQVGTVWPFNTVVVDESTTIKNHRCRFQRTETGKWSLHLAGTKNAASLMAFAQATKRWINLTGTPTPNGLVDLWGQQWPVDFGDALGYNHSAFIHTYFRQRFGTAAEQQRYDPMPGSDIVIAERMKSTSIVVDAYDWFDISKPVVSDLKFDLPPKARAMYDKMNREAVLELSKDDVLSAANMGGALMKCRQIASGHVLDETCVRHHVHSAKIEALQDLVESLNGEPLLVAYWFNADRDDLMKAFKNAVTLPADSRQDDVMNRWNAGKIQMLLVHPQSAGHGLSLQHGGNNICLYTVDWNAEYYEQVIERLGPTRQAQSGYKRLVYVHRLVAANTWDETIAKKLTSKISVSAAVKQSLKEQK